MELEDCCLPQMREKGGKAVGFSVQIARAAAKAMNLELEIRAGRWDLAMKELEMGRIDFVPIMADTPERRKLFNFTAPHTVVYDAIFFKKGTTGLHSLKDLSGYAIATTERARGVE